jgi:hypothetical protein
MGAEGYLADLCWYASPGGHKQPVPGPAFRTGIGGNTVLIPFPAVLFPLGSLWAAVPGGGWN